MQLKALLSETLTSLDGLDDHVISHLVQEGTLTDGAMQDFDRHVQALVHNECPILVAGRWHTANAVFKLFPAKKKRDVDPVVRRLRWPRRANIKPTRHWVDVSTLGFAALAHQRSRQ